MNDIQPVPLSSGELEAAARRAIDDAQRAGASQTEVAVSAETGLAVTVRLGEVETLEYHKDHGMGITVYFGQRKGSASTSDLRPNAVSETVAAACRIARYTAEDACAGLADAALMARDWPDLELDHPWDISADDAIELARSCETAAREADQRIVNSEGGSVNTFRGTAVYANSHGFVGGYTATRHSVSCSVVGEADGAMQRDYWYSISRLPEALEPAEAIGRQAAERTVRRLSGRKLSTREAPVLFAADVARSVIGHFVGAIRGPALYRKASFLLDHLEKQVFPEFVHIHEQPHLRGALGSAPFDNEGVATRSRDVVTDGRLMGYVLDSYAARRLGMQTTANAGGVRNLTIDPGEHDFEGLLAEMGTGLLVTELIGHGVNVVTGDYSRGAAGFWVEDGAIQYPVEEITIAGNLRDVFMGLRAVGSDVDLRGNIRTGSLLIDRMTIAGD